MQITKMRKQRIKNAWTLKSVGEFAGIAKQTVSDIESMRQKPSYDVLVKLEELFNMTHKELFQIVEE